jgi:hypothetical protein
MTKHLLVTSLVIAIVVVACGDGEGEGGGQRRKDSALDSLSWTRSPYLTGAPTTHITTDGLVIRESWVRIPIARQRRFRNSSH